MRQLQGLKALKQLVDEKAAGKAAVEWLLHELEHCHCNIFGELESEPVLLAKLGVQAGSLQYEMFDRRIDFVLSGNILRGDCVPLTYRLNGIQFAISGRCSSIPQVCGVDWYLGNAYSGKVGDIAQLKFNIPLYEVLQAIKKLK